MSDWTCDQVKDWIDLDAAGEADAPTRAAVARHLEGCPSCAESHRQARQVVGLLDQRYQERERLARLWARLGAAPQRQARPAVISPRRRGGMWGRVAALAASALVALGLSGWLGPGGAAAPLGIQLAAVVRPPERLTPRTVELAPPGPPVDFKAADAAAPGAQKAPAEYVLDLGGKAPAAYRDEVRAAARKGQPPMPPAVDLELKIRNPGRERLMLLFDDPETVLTLDLRGPGVLGAPAPGAVAPLANLGNVRLGPGDSITVPVHELAEGARGAVRYLYWTEPGEYTLTVTVRVRVGPAAGARELTASAGPFRLPVVAAPAAENPR